MPRQTWPTRVERADTTNALACRRVLVSFGNSGQGLGVPNA